MPSVGLRAIARIIPSPMCCATSQVTVCVSPSRATSIRSAVWISGSPSGGNSTSTTGPITRATRPCASVSSAMSHSLEARASAPPTISMISVVISSWRARLACRVSTLMSSSALSVAAAIARCRAAFSEAADSSSAK